MAFKLDPESALRSEIARVVREQLAAAIKRAGQRRAAPEDRVRQGRIRCKKVRAALRLVRPQEPKVYRRANARLGKAARELSAFRDADVMLDTLAALARHTAHASARRALEPVRRALQAEAETVQASAAERERRLEAFGRALQAEAKRLAKWEPVVGMPEVAANLAVSYKRARRAMHLARKHPSADALHAWRKATKVYAYQCGLLGAAWPRAMQAWRDELTELGRRLGEERDLSLLARRLMRLPSRGRGGVDEETLRVAVALIEARQEALRHEAFDFGERLFFDRPRAVAARTRAWWRVARREQRQARDAA